MTGPGPSPAEIETMLRAGARVPDHGKLAPWRFILIEGDGRNALGTVLLGALAETEPNASPERQALEEGRFLRAPLVIAVVSSVREGVPIPEWEQVLSAGAVCQNILIAAHAQGFVANWITEWYAYHPKVAAALGLRAGERIAGFLYVGRPAIPLEERVRPRLDDLVSRFRGALPSTQS